jgi:hypothetical protein
MARLSENTPQDSRARLAGVDRVHLGSLVQPNTLHRSKRQEKPLRLPAEDRLDGDLSD